MEKFNRGDLMEVKFKDYCYVLKENLESFKGQYDEFIDYSPEIFNLLTKLLELEEIKVVERLKISAAIAYFVVPNDIIPENIYGPYGYVDDIFISTFVIKEIAEKIGYGQLQELWAGDGNIKEIVDLCYHKSKKIVSNDSNEILHHVGLK